MTIEEVKSYLNQAYYIDKRVEILQDELLLLESKLEKCSPSYTTTKCGSSQPSFEIVLDKVMYYRERLNSEIDNLVDTKKSIHQFIECNLSDNTQKIVLLKRYINYQKYEDIALDINYSTRQVINIANKGIKNISLNFTKKV